ncbi:hypothetical protein V494_01528 [Pseudogymnoascus sp. VKM F-4513 (FW-928)]|nr:hypothetical protein V494_01528 [Pseudogymnoascus sp. VKM F-4513 (FW-928)]
MRAQTPFSLLISLGWLSLSQAITNGPFGQYADRCPAPCAELGPSTSDWMRLHRLQDLQRCDQPLLFGLNVKSSVSDPKTQISIRACSLPGTEDSALASPVVRARDASAISQAGTANSLTVANSCGAKPKQVKSTVHVGPKTGISKTVAPVSASDIALAASQLSDYLHNRAPCGPTIMFAKAGNAVVGLYSGAEVQKASAANLVDMFQDQARNGSVILQICQTNSTGDHMFGIFAGGMDDLASVQDAVKTWTSAQCINSQGHIAIESVNMDILVSVSDSDGAPSSNSTKTSRSINARATCKDIQAKAGAGCASLASTCGISLDTFKSYNPIPNLCTIKINQWYCCTPGTPAEHGLPPQSDGTCYTYNIQPGDGCSDIADAFGITQSVIENNNDNTWGWTGCGDLQLEQVICLGKGSPPFPKPVEGVICGPQVPGSVKPTDGTEFTNMNPCPLNTCCDVWGYCGTTPEFCTKTPADTGAPGTAKPNTNGCISNCGMDIINNSSPPASFIRVGYFEGWNANRPCLTADITKIDKSGLTHIHFAFATVTADWKISVSDVQDQFTKFTKITGVKKILSFGGWTFSTDPSSFQRFRDATKPANRAAFAINAVAFLKANNLDGLDFDWEYPGAPDIPDIPAGSADEGANYLAFLKLVKTIMPSTASLSIALPASYWYLKQYPVAQMHTYVDYFIYMTYDYHGQWDAGHHYSVDGCYDGNCLRSHVNKTETRNSLVMITKAGVPANKVLVGITSYGRGFRMSDVTCSGPMCTYTGDDKTSNAYKGRCTETGGYISNAEIKEIISNHGTNSLVTTYFDTGSDSNILVYGTQEKADWVAYMDDSTKSSRISWIKGLNFGGATDWATDLDKFVDPAGGDDGDGDGDGGTDPDDVCKATDRTYSSEKAPEGKFMNEALMNPELIMDRATQYPTIVNLTPHRFVYEKDRGNSYQYDKFDFVDVPPGQARQQETHKASTSHPEDTKGEAYFSIKGTDKYFIVQSATHIPDEHSSRTIFDLRGMGLGWREYKDPNAEVAVTLVITGSNDYGFISNIQFGPGNNWMKKIYSTIKDREIRHIVMPGTHDSGMTEISRKIISSGSRSNTQTQGINFYKQLTTGARWFDLRVASIHNSANLNENSFWALHVNDQNVPVVIGNTGASLDSIIEEINQFTAEYPGEVIFIRLRYLVGIRNVPSLGPITWDSGMILKFFAKLEEVNNRCGNLNTPFQEQKASYFMDQNQGKGCVIFIMNDSLKNNEDRKSSGIYNKIAMEFWDDWTDNSYIGTVASTQADHWQTINRNSTDGTNDDKIMVSQWFASGPITTSSIEAVSMEPHNPTLYWYGVNRMSPERWPNVLQVNYMGQVIFGETDFSQMSADLVTLCVGLNLYMISENCNISKRRNPLLKPLTKKSSIASFASVEKPSLASEPVIHFANGTIIKNPTPEMYPKGVAIFKKGTVFGNGTVLEKDTPNPWY